MKHQTQHDVVKRLSMSAKKIMRDRIENPAATMVRDRWAQTKADLGAFARGVWAQDGADQGLHLAEPARYRIAQHFERALRDFRDEAVEISRAARLQAFELQYKLDHWILDQVTPPTIKVVPKRDPAVLSMQNLVVHRPIGKKAKESHHADPRRRKLTESWFTDPIAGPSSTGEDGTPETSTDQRIDGWTKAWGQAAIGNIMLGGIQGDTPEDIDARVDATTAGGSNLDGILDRIIRTQVEISIADADDEFGDDYSDLLGEGIWQTMDDERVCPICESQDGLPESEWTYDQPAHPRCRCWKRMVPKAYQDLAGDQAVPGAADDAMAIRDPRTGETVGSVLVEFSGWSQGL